MSIEFEVRIARMEERFSSMADSLERIEKTTTGLSNIGEKIGQALAHADEHMRTVNAQWKKLDDMNIEISQLQHFRSQIRGAMWALGIVMTTLGGIGAASILWLFASTASNESMNSVQQHRLNELDRRLDHLLQRP